MPTPPPSPRRHHIRIAVGPTMRRFPALVDARFENGNAVIVCTDDSGRRCELEHHTYLWQLWPDRNCPLTASEELKFAADLRAAARKAPPSKPRNDDDDERGDVTSLLNAMRCGLSVTKLLDVAPGLDPKRLDRTYRHLERLRLKGISAWEAISENPDVATFEEHSENAATVVPVPVRQLARAITVRQRHQILRDVSRRIAANAVAVERVEAVVETFSHPDPVAVEVGRLLYDPYDTCLWSDPYHLPVRIGALSPVRVRNLLGEAT